jgi:uncharacterized membrane protein YkvA (DUF1232 family)
MNLKMIRGMISQAKNHENQTRTLANCVIAYANMMGHNLSTQQVNNTVSFIREYIEHVPVLLEEVELAAKKAGVMNQIRPILQAAEGYFLQPFDLIPDSLGLIGLMDDAYLVHTLMQSLSDHYKQKTGVPLLATDLTQANLLIRVLLGEPTASTLDFSVMNLIQGPNLQSVIQQLISLAGSAPMNVPDPMWGNASIDEIVDARLGALGVIR